MSDKKKIILYDTPNIMWYVFYTMTWT